MVIKELFTVIGKIDTWNILKSYKFNYFNFKVLKLINDCINVTLHKEDTMSQI